MASCGQPCHLLPFGQFLLSLFAPLILESEEQVNKRPSHQCSDLYPHQKSVYDLEQSPLDRLHSPLQKKVAKILHRLKTLQRPLEQNLHQICDLTTYLLMLQVLLVQSSRRPHLYQLQDHLLLSQLALHFLEHRL